MSSDVLDDLRRANPVHADGLKLPPGFAERARTGRHRRALTLVGSAVLVTAVLAFVVLARGGSPDLAARAYAAVSGPGIVHWRTDIAGYANGKVATRQRIEGWSAGAVTHTVISGVAHGKARVNDDIRVDGRRVRTWLAGEDDYSSSTLPATPAPLQPLPSGDPMAAFRRAYREGRLRRLGGGRFAVRFAHITPDSIVYRVDLATGQPRELTISNGPGSQTRVRFSVYERLPDTRKNRKRLALLAHPGAGRSDQPASRYFAALRNGPLLTGPHAADLRRMPMNQRFHVDTAGIRTLTDNAWLLPGRGSVCLVVALRNGLGGTCQNLKVAALRGLTAGGIFAAPDGVTAVKIRERGNRVWQRFPVRKGVAHLPQGYIGIRVAH